MNRSPTTSRTIRFTLLTFAMQVAFVASTATTWANTEVDADIATPEPCADCVDTEGEHTANNTNQYCWRLGNVALPDANGRCAPGWTKETIGAQIVRRNRFIDMCAVAESIAFPPYCATGCIGDASIVERKVTATTCYIKMKRDCEPIGKCVAPLPTTEVQGE